MAVVLVRRVERLEDIFLVKVGSLSVTAMDNEVSSVNDDVLSETMQLLVQTYPACCSRSFCSKLVDDFRMPLFGAFVKFSAIAK